jgi:myosin heavy subunit
LILCLVDLVLGKTESTKQVLRYLASISSKVVLRIANDIIDNDFESLIVATSPITESFGNAKTSRNNNSSRFGKFIELFYSPDGYIEGAVISTYLLETVRLIYQMPGERNYHVFYEIFAGLDPELKAEFGLTTLQSFRYTNQSGEFSRYDGESDTDNYHALLTAMKRINLDSEEIENVFRTVAGILHVGNLLFEECTATGSEGAIFSQKCDSHIDNIRVTLGIDSRHLLQGLTERNITIAGSTITKRLPVEGAINARDAFAKTLYDLVFKWMIQSVNNSLKFDDYDDRSSVIGVLDIFGFEYFTANSFEQLWYNYSTSLISLSHF